MSKLNLRPLPLALACLLAPFHQALAADTSTIIPLDLIQENYGGGQYGYRLGINVGVNGAAPEEYLFDTGSDSFNIDVGTGNNGHAPAWFPNQPGVAQSAPYAYLYGNGTYGYWQASTTVASVQFYDSATGARAANYATQQGLPVATAIDWMVTPQSAGGDTLGPAVTTQGGVTLYQDLTWQQNLNQGRPPEEGLFYGTFGAGDFGNGVPGMLTSSGYIVEANGTGTAPGACAQACLIVGLTPALRAQFLSVAPWLPTQGQTTPFPLSGAPSAYQFDTAFLYTLTDGKGNSVSAPMMTLFDTGTPNIMLIDNGDLGLASAEQAAGNLNANGNLVPGITLTATGLAVTANGLAISGQPASITSGNDSQGDYSNVVTLGAYGGFPDAAIYGLSFFMHNAVMYDLQNQATAYTPFYISTANITTGFTVTPDMGPLGLAGTISGSGPFQVASGGIADLSGSNTYTGATQVAKGGWLALAGPGSIAASSDVHVDGIFDISRTWQITTVQSLSGTGLVQLGDTTLDLTNASGSFGGQIADGGIGGGSGGRLIVSGGQETLVGHNTFTGATGVSATATLDVEGSLASGVVNLGMLVDNGDIAGNVVNGGLLAGHGSIGGSLATTGIVAPGTGPGQYRTLSVAGNFSQSAGSTYLVQLDPAQAGVSSLVAVGGSATLDAGAGLGVATAPGGLYQVGARYTVLDAAQGLSGTYRLAGNGVLTAVLGITPGYDANRVYLTVAQTRPLTAAGGTPNERAVLATAQGVAGVAGRATDTGIGPAAWRAVAVPAASGPAAFATVFTALANLPTDAALRTAADQLSGEIHATAQGVLLDDSRYVRDAVAGRLRQAGTGAAAAAGGPSVQEGQGGLAWWGQFVGTWGHRDSDGNAATAKHTSGGFLLGADHALGEHARFGIAAGYTQTAVNAPARDSSVSSRDLDLSVYAGAQFGALGLRAGAAYGWHNLDSTRFVAVPGLVGHELGSYHAATAQLFGEAGYRFTFRRTTLEPFAQVARVRLRTGGFQEHGGIANLTGKGESHPVSYSTLGARATTGFPFHGDQKLSMHAMLGWRRAYGRIGTATSMASGGARFDVEGLPIARNALAADAGLTVRLAKHASFDLSWHGQAARHAMDSGFHGGFDWQF
ncbi:autotransporter outer membrane beta-barrel domain-containing protein [Rhodanobacter aciditrophus]|uniref:autotransporter outer membrane beta-barrel domain-containing protein n=1 Tax=Rhodanobacter aciditrophus TaxID=1623218 RepID=UPI003CF0DDA0